MLAMRSSSRSGVTGVTAALGLVLSALPSAADPVFTDVTSSAGVGYLQHAPQSGANCLFGWCEPERLTGGAAVADVNGDGDVDLFVTRLDDHDLLFLSEGDGTFSDGTSAAGLAGSSIQTNGAAFGDIDNDGDADLFVTTLGDGTAPNDRDYLYLNDGSGSFSEAAIARGAAAQGATMRTGFGAAFGDYDRDGWLDLMSVEWRVLHPVDHSRLLRNRGVAQPGFFDDQTAAAGLSLASVDGFAPAFSDLDADGWPDLTIAADFGTSRLFWNDGDGTFTDGTASAMVGTDENGMGSSIADWDGDGDLDWFVTAIDDPADTCSSMNCNWGSSGNRLYRYDGSRTFGDATDSAGVRAGYWGWGAAFFDYDNDGDLDLAMTNGIDFPGMTIDDPFNANPMRLWRNDGPGAMTEVSASAQLTDTGAGKGLLVVDYDDDGDLDLFVVNNAGQPRLYRNDGGNANAWLRVRAVGVAANRDGIGVRVRVQRTPDGDEQLREIGSASHFIGQSERIAHFGLGPGLASVHSVVVEWPGGPTHSFSDVPANQTLVVYEISPSTPARGGGALWLAAGLLFGIAAALLRPGGVRRGR
jgi:hypothetical protein